MFTHKSLNLLTEWRTEVHLLVKKRLSLFHEVVTYMGLPQGDTRLFVSTTTSVNGQRHNRPCNLQLGTIGMLCDTGYPASVEIAAFKIHPTVGLGRVLA
jgi:hypothetical protein